MWKETQDDEYYIDHFYKEVLSKLTPEDVVNEIANTLPIDAVGFALVCYEAPDKFCHRHLVADWLIKSLKIEVKEL